MIDPITRSDKRISRSSAHASILTDWLIVLRADKLVSHNHDAICRTLPWEHCRSCGCRHWGMYQCRSSDIDRDHSQEERKHGDGSRIVWHRAPSTRTAQVGGSRATETLSRSATSSQSGFCLLDPNHRVILSTTDYLDILVMFDGCEWVHEVQEHN